MTAARDRRSDRLPRDVRRMVLGNTLSALGTGFTLPFLHIYLTDVRGFDVRTAGYAIATLGFVGVCVAGSMGSLSDRIGPGRVLVGALLLESLGTAGLAFVTKPWHAFLTIAVLAVGQAATWPSQAALIANLVPSARRSRVFAVQFALLNLGIGVGGAVSGLLVDIEDVRSFQTVYLVDSLSFVGYVLILLTIRNALAHTRHDAPAGDGGPGGYLEVLRDRVFLRVCLVTLLMSVAGYGQILAGFPGFARGVAHVSTRAIGFAFAANTVVIVVAQLGVQRRLTGRRRTRALAGVGVIWALSWLVIGSSALVDGPLTAIAVISGLALFGLGETLWAPTGSTLVNDIAPPHLRGRYNALSSITWQFSSVIGPVVAGVLLEARMPAVFILGLAGMLLGVAVLAVRLERHLTPAQNGLVLDAAPGAVLPAA